MCDSNYILLRKTQNYGDSEKPVGSGMWRDVEGCRSRSRIWGAVQTVCDKVMVDIGDGNFV